MTINVGNGDFNFLSQVDPGQKLEYLYYQGTIDDDYDVSVEGTPFFSSPYYFVFALESAEWGSADTIVSEVAGTFEAGTGDDLLYAGSGSNVPAPAAPLTFLGGGGNDSINPLTDFDPTDSGVIIAYGGSQNDSINGSDVGDQLYGDTVNSFTGYPVIAGFTGAFYDPDDDGDDVINGYDGDDTISGDGGNDQLDGGEGADTLTGGDGNDFLYGGPRGGGNLDILTGGTGADAFVLSYTQAAAGSAGAGFWSAYFEQAGEDVAGNAANAILTDAIKAATDAGVAAGFLADGLGAVGGELVQSFVGFVESLFASPTPGPGQDAMVVTDFDPREDVLILPLQTKAEDVLSVTVITASQVPGIDSDSQDKALQFTADNQNFAYVLLSQDFLTDMGLGGTGDGTGQVLNNLLQFRSTIGGPQGSVGFSNLVSSTISQQLADGGFVPQDADLPAGSSVLLYGAIGGAVVANGPSGTSYGSVLAGTNYADALSTNPSLVDPARITSFAKTGAYIHGFGGDDLVYGTNEPDTLFGDLGDDTLYSFLSTVNSDNGINRETLTGGGGDDTLYGGGTAGDFDGGDGSDTFGVIYSAGNEVLQLQVDLTIGKAAESPLLDVFVPVGDSPPFSFSMPNNYKLTGIENAIGGPANDWLKAASGSVLEGAAGADYLDAKAGKVTLSYASSAAGVSVQVYADGVVSSGGDAQGDVVGFTGQPDIVALIGSGQDDVLGLGLADGKPVFTGNGGSDRFQVLSLPASDPGIFTVTDFDQTSGEADLIDLGPLGITAIGGVQDFGDGLWAVSATDGSFLLEIVLPNFLGTLDASDFLLARGVSGRAVADPAGQALVGGQGGDLLLGRGGDDFLFGKGGTDVLRGRDGQDALHGGAGADRLFGDAGQDRVDGNAGRDVVYGGAGDDRLTGGRGDDLLFGGAGADTLSGGGGDDLLRGGLGADTMRGDAGADSFRLRLGELEGDVVADYARHEGDRLVVLADAAVTVIDRGGGEFLLTDGTVSETLTVAGAVAADFLL